jgi:hypothetical protein
LLFIVNVICFLSLTAIAACVSAAIIAVVVGVFARIRPLSLFDEFSLLSLSSLLQLLLIAKTNKYFF